MYGNTKIEDKNFLALIFVLVIKKATIPPYKIAITDDKIDITREFLSGIQKRTLLIFDANNRFHHNIVLWPISKLGANIISGICTLKVEDNNAINGLKFK